MLRPARLRDGRFGATMAPGPRAERPGPQPWAARQSEGGTPTMGGPAPQTRRRQRGQKPAATLTLHFGAIRKRLRMRCVLCVPGWGEGTEIRDYLSAPFPLLAFARRPGRAAGDGGTPSPGDRTARAGAAPDASRVRPLSSARPGRTTRATTARIHDTIRTRQSERSERFGMGIFELRTFEARSSDATAISKKCQAGSWKN